MRALLSLTLLPLLVLVHAGVHALHVFDQPGLFSTRSQCKPIPPALHLCHEIEYAEMRLPNLLGHEAMSEVLQQAASWVPLVQKRCHPDTRKFLCSLFAPVCLPDVDEPIRPCRSLCEAVRHGCAPVMAAFGFPWPEMLRCSRFPPDDDLCIPAGDNGERATAANETVPKVCDACKEKIEDDSEMVDSLCKNDFALKIKVKEITYMNGDTKIVPETKSKTIYKLNGVTERDLRKTALLLKDGLQCSCEEMNDINSAYLVMGQKQDGNLVITSLKRWQKGQREFKRISRSIRKMQC
ncbi:secreted frizzled-related protein 2 [Astyanax mexicanus]|uniref:Secreted frizzled-related protein 2 n=1 Tax=Astyanax mexicanus TaxID=7994 RepID=A0A8B9LQR4_ASTMX|nr:secreted frizzled-related protein 2 [Astyanax mexicanus]KAG9259978.1 secreted frizzled-related protein 2 [Astyanax mexicanus]